MWPLDVEVQFYNIYDTEQSSLNIVLWYDALVAASDKEVHKLIPSIWS